MKKICKRFIWIISLMLMILNISYIYAEDDFDETQESVDSYIDTQLRELDLDEMQKQLEESIVLEQVDLMSFLKEIIAGEKNILDIFDKDVIKEVLFSELKNSLKISSIILILALLSSLLKSLDNSFSSGTITKIVNYIVFIMIVSVVLIGFKDILAICSSTIDTTMNIVSIVLPIMLGLIALNGLTITSTVMTPIFVGAISFINLIFKDFVLVTISVAFAVIVINNLSKSIKLKRLSTSIKNINLLAIGSMLTIYLLVVSMQMLYIKNVDGFALTSAKYAVGNFIPVVGGFLSDSINILISSSQLIKSIFGGLGLVILLGVCLIPVIKIVSVIFVYKICSIVVEPIGEEGISSFLGEVANLMTIILACVIAIVFMFFVTIAVLTSMSAVTPG